MSIVQEWETREEMIFDYSGPLRFFFWQRYASSQTGGLGQLRSSRDLNKSLHEWKCETQHTRVKGKEAMPWLWRELHKDQMRWREDHKHTRHAQKANKSRPGRI